MLPVIALGEGITLAQVLNLLADAGIPRYVVCPESDSLRYSRWYRELPHTTTLTPASLADDLDQLPIERAVLLPCSDDWTQAVGRLPADLARRFPSSTPTVDAIESLVNKWRFAQVLQREGLPHPRTRLVTSYEELGSLPDSEFRSSLLKPLFSSIFSAKHRAKGYMPEAQEDALQFMANKEFPIMLQEFIPGPPTAAYMLDGFIDRNGRICGMVARRRLRQFPPQLGNTTLSITVPLSEVTAADEALRHLLAAIKYRGIFSAEFKYNERDGLFKLLEINARPWWYVEFTARCGLDVCRMAYCDALNLPIETVQKYEVGRRCGYIVDDLRGWWGQRRSGVSLWSWMRPWIGATQVPFHWKDPGPAIAFFPRMMKGHIAHRAQTKVPHKSECE